MAINRRDSYAKLEAWALLEYSELLAQQLEMRETYERRKARVEFWANIVAKVVTFFSFPYIVLFCLYTRPRGRGQSRNASQEANKTLPIL
jgi:hypothetical protein